MVSAGSAKARVSEGLCPEVDLSPERRVSSDKHPSTTRPSGLFLGRSLFFGLVPDGAVVDSGQYHYPFVLDVDG